MNISIGRLRDDPEASLVVRADDGAWQVVVDNDNVPHLYVRVQFEPDPDDPSAPRDGLLCVEDLLPNDSKIRDLMNGAFGGKLSPEEEAAAIEEMKADRAKHPIPCPR